MNFKIKVINSVINISNTDETKTRSTAAPIRAYGENRWKNNRIWENKIRLGVPPRPQVYLRYLNIFTYIQPHTIDDSDIFLTPLQMVHSPCVYIFQK